MIFKKSKIDQKSIKIDQNRLILAQDDPNDASNFISVHSGHFHVRPKNGQKTICFMQKGCPGTIEIGHAGSCGVENIIDR